LLELVEAGGVVLVVAGTGMLVVGDTAEVVLVFSGGGDVYVPLVVGKLVGGGGGVAGREGDGKQVLTCRPAVSDARPSCCRGSEGPGGSVPTNALKL
jgi:hypothetical protein